MSIKQLFFFLKELGYSEAGDLICKYTYYNDIDHLKDYVETKRKILFENSLNNVNYRVSSTCDI